VQASPFLSVLELVSGRSKFHSTEFKNGYGAVELTRVSFAYFEMSLILAKMHFQCDLELVDPTLDWLEDSYLHVMWWKPALYIRFKTAKLEYRV
jgi:hypothetical protein